MWSGQTWHALRLSFLTRFGGTLPIKLFTLTSSSSSVSSRGGGPLSVEHRDISERFHADSSSIVPIDRTCFAGFWTVGNAWSSSASKAEFSFEDEDRFPKATTNTGEPLCYFEIPLIHTLCWALGSRYSTLRPLNHKPGQLSLHIFSLVLPIWAHSVCWGINWRRRWSLLGLCTLFPLARRHSCIVGLGWRGY